MKEITSLLELKMSPQVFKLNSEIYGIQYGDPSEKKIVKKVLFTIDLSLEAIHYALKNKVNLIISFHGLINNSIQNFNKILINKLSLLVKYPISIFVLNSTFIGAEGGISETIMNALYLTLDKTFDITSKNGKRIPIGRIGVTQDYPYQKKSLTLEDLIKRIQSNLELEKISYVGDLSVKIKKVCIIGCDNFLNIKDIEKALKCECNCLISSRFHHKDAIFAKEAGLCLIEISLYKTKMLAMKKLCNILSLEFPYDEFLFFNSKDPFETY